MRPILTLGVAAILILVTAAADAQSEPRYVRQIRADCTEEFPGNPGLIAWCFERQVDALRQLFILTKGNGRDRTLLLCSRKYRTRKHATTDYALTLQCFEGERATT